MFLKEAFFDFFPIWIFFFERGIVWVFLSELYTERGTNRIMYHFRKRESSYTNGIENSAIKSG